MIKRSMILRVAEGAKTFDMENLFPPRPLLEEMADAATGGAELLPRRTLRERHYGPQPLMLRPKYKGDFLEQMSDKTMPDLMEGEGVFLTAGDPSNLLDFTMPSEMLKHQEAPTPRELPPVWTEFNRPGDGAGMDTLRDYYDRSWDPNDSPEMSEDKHFRMWNQKNYENKVRKNLRPQNITPLLKNVVKSHLEATAGIVSFEDLVHAASHFNARVAFTLDDLSDAKRLQDGSYKDISTAGVSVFPSRNTRPNLLRYVFRTTSGDGWYTTTFQFIPKGLERDPNKLHVRVSCTCPAWLFWGSQFNAYQNRYLYGPIRPKLTPPRVRDPQGQTYICKHGLACIELLRKYKLSAVPEEIRDKIEKQPRITVRMPKEEEPERIPKDLQKLEKNPRVKFIENQWPKASARQRKNYIMKLDDPDMVTYFAHKFPETATKYVAQKLRDMWAQASPSEKKAIEENISEIPDTEVELPKEVKLPAELRRWEKSPLSRLAKTLPGMSPAEKRQVINIQKNPDFLAFLAFKLHDDPDVVEPIINRLEALRDMGRKRPQKIREVVREQLKRAKEEDVPSDAPERAEHWLSIII